ncbi:MAG: hypothetical protein JXA09_15730 [Anaerolineae bacterium]|nr:hypothetical protein [Anaerolineae bacterium]
MFELKPDYEACKARIDAFWERELIDRPVVQFSVAKPPEACVPLPLSGHASPEERWLDAEYQAELKLAQLRNRVYMGDAMPIAWPNLGPEVFSSFYGCPIRFGDFGTSWTEPILTDWAQADELVLDWESPYLAKLHEMTDALLEVGQGVFITGMTDWHPGGDALAALRDPEQLAIDLILHRSEVQTLLDRVEADYYRVYDLFYDKLRRAGQPISTWTTLVCDAKFYVPSNDFSIMIGEQMFREVFLPGIERECQFLDRSIYHLDGPGALRHLDAVLGIQALHALQWIPGAGNEGFARWIDVYRRAQATGKGIQVLCTLGEVDLIMETLDPHGVFLSVGGVPSREEGEALLRALERWCVQHG